MTVMLTQDRVLAVFRAPMTDDEINRLFSELFKQFRANQNGS